ncbi:hypothetical protein B0H34DRAFT_648482 [Crassisporium funariophilum]|nr:hypothetical protein B0H34DRAFT_648482 [Crassisporium funariophilum]
MDNTPEGDLPALNYDDTVAYEEQLPTEEEANAAASLARRIGSSKVYLLSESSAGNRAGKRKHNEDEDEDQMNEDDIMDEDSLAFRPNALLLTGTPISHLPTARIFAYATHFDAHPMGLEWVDDITCVLVFESTKSARSAFALLQKSAAEAPDMDEYVAARPIPVALWPADERISQTLGVGKETGLKGTIRMRWARGEDVKKKGAKRESEFYKKHGQTAGKELFNGRDLPPTKRRRREDSDDDDRRRAELDNELDEFLAEDDDNERKATSEEVEEDVLPDVPASPPSKMRSDYIGNDGRTLLERTSLIRVHPSDPLSLASRLTAPLPRRARHREGRNGDKCRRGGRGGGGERTDRPPRGGGGGDRPRKTQQELDDELDAFLNSHD